MTVICFETTQHYGVAASPPPPVLRLHGDRIVDGLLWGEAFRMGSTPPSRVMTADTPFGPPSVATTMTASPFCKAASVAGGSTLSFCCDKARNSPPPPISPPPHPASHQP